MNKEQFWALFKQGAQGGQQGAMSAFEQQAMDARAKQAQASELERLIKGEEMKRQAELDDRDYREGKFNELVGKFGPKAKISVSDNGLSYDPESAINQQIANDLKQQGATSQEVMRLSQKHKSDVGDLGEKLKDTEVVLNMLADPTQQNDASVQRILAMALNKGALTDEDVRQAVPSDLSTWLRKGYNFVTPGNKIPVFDEAKRKALSDYVKNTYETRRKQYDSAVTGFEKVAPSIAPTLYKNQKEYANVMEGMDHRGQEAEKRIDTGLNLQFAGAPQTPKIPGAGQTAIADGDAERAELEALRNKYKPKQP